GKAEDDHDYEVVRLPRLRLYLELLRWSDVCLCANVSLRGLLPIMIARTPLVISHHGGYGSPAKTSVAVRRESRGFRDRRSLSQILIAMKSLKNTAMSPGILILYLSVALSLIKGVSDLIDALSVLGGAGLRPRLSIVGDGPERPAILARVEELGLDSQVSFIGIKRGCDLARFIARHRLMVVPSRWPEPFGLVALEGIACGCVVVGTDQGGLPEAIGPCGITVPNGNSAAMARALELLLEDDGSRASYRSYAPGHLARHSRSIVARRYLDVLESVTSCKASRGCSQLS